MPSMERERLRGRAQLNTGVKEPHYAIHCPECGVVAVKGPLFYSSYEVRGKGKCYKCASVIWAQYGPANASVGCSTYQDRHPMILENVDLTVAWGPRSKKYIAWVAGQATTTAANVADASGVDPTVVEEFIKAAARTAVSEVVDEVKGVVEAAKEAMDSMAPTVVHIHSNDRPDLEVDLSDRHHAYPKVMDALMACGKCMLVGPPGSGKSTLARQVAEDLGYGFTFLPCTEGLSEAHILGRSTATGEYLPTAFVMGFEGSGPYTEKKVPGVVHLWDEVDAMDANTGLVINEALSNGHIAIPNRPSNPFATMRANYFQIAAGNTWGTGAEIEHTGRNALDAAFTDRFAVLKIFVDYDVERERRIAKAGGIEQLAEALWKVRANARAHQVRRPVSTRAFINSAKLHRLSPERWPEPVLLEAFFAGWPTPERAKVMEGVTLGHTPPGSEAPAHSDVAAAPNQVRCPKCRGPMIRRVAMRGPRRGRPFYGCRNFPRCDGTLDIQL